MFRFSAFASAVALALCVGFPLTAADAPKPAEPAQPVAVPEGKPIDLVLCLDVSGSMNGLIDSAKLRLWDIVNEMARLKPTPVLRVSLYSYGASNYPADKGWVRKDLDLTEDLDEVYKVLNAYRTGGGEELVARVTKAALTEQKWSKEKDSLKLIFVCGNEPVDQDKQVTLDSVADLAKKENVIVNTIYCGPANYGEAAAWAKFGEKCGGRYMNIDMNKAAKQVVVKTEFDEQILKLNEQLNKTYVAYGKEGEAKALNQAVQDKNAANAPAAPGAGGGSGPPVAAIERSVSKAGALYRNSTWDLVDKMKDKDFDIKKIKDEDLCEEMKKMKPEERLAFLKKKADERADIQKQIGELAAKRQKKIDEELAKTPKTDGEKALDEALKGIVRDQAKGKGFEVTPMKK
jgi:hypothetical protein